MFKKILSLALAVVMVMALCVTFASCDKPEDEEKLGMSESPLPRPQLTTEVTVPDDFKIGFIMLHDENSTYDKNFIDAAKSIKTLLGLTDDQFVIKINVDESDACYQAAKELAEDGCDIIFADSFGHEAYMIQAAKEYPDVEFCVIVFAVRIFGSITFLQCFFKNFTSPGQKYSSE